MTPSPLIAILRLLSASVPCRLPGLQEGSYADLLFSKLEIIPGQAVYLNISNYADVVIVCDSSYHYLCHSTNALSAFDEGTTN